MTTIKKTLTGLGAAALIATPSLAFAQDGVKTRVGIEARIDKAIERIEKKDTHDKKKELRSNAHATSTAAAYAKQAIRVQTAADSMLSFDARITALIAGADADERATLEAQYAEFKSDAQRAKAEAGSAAAAAAQVKAENSTTTNATLLANAKIDLREARNFFVEAKVALFSILRALWH